MHIVFPITFTVSSGVMVILLVFHAGDPGSVPVEGTIFFFCLQSYFSHFLYILQQEFSSVLHKIKRSSQKFPSANFFYKFSNPKHIITVMVTDMRLCQTY